MLAACCIDVAVICRFTFKLSFHIGVYLDMFVSVNICNFNVKTNENEFLVLQQFATVDTNFGFYTAIGGLVVLRLEFWVYRAFKY